MKFDRRLFISFIVILAVMLGVCDCTVSTGGGASISSNAGGSASGNFEISNGGFESSASSTGPVTFDETRFVDDGIHHVDIRLMVDDGYINNYLTSYKPKIGGNVRPTNKIEITDTLDITNADQIIAQTTARTGSSDESFLGLDITRAGSIGSIFQGTIKATADKSTQAFLEGHAEGALKSYGTAYDGTNTASQQGDSNGQPIICDLDMMASTRNMFVGGNGKFYVDKDTVAGKIQDAVNAAWDGDTINIEKGTYNENVVVDKSVTIKGTGESNTIVDGHGISGSVFTIGKNNPKADTTLLDMTIKGGSGTLVDQDGNTLGGGIINWGTLTAKDCTISDNIAYYGAGIENLGTITVIDGMVTRNTAKVDAGGISNAGTMTIEDSTISSNHADNSDGGGINNGGKATIINSLISKNTAGWAGGIDNGYTGDLTVKGSTISDNTVTGYGGGICNSDGKVNLENSLILGNIADQEGGGIWNRGEVIMSGSTISGNNAYNAGGIYNSGTATVTGSTISGNSAAYIGGGIYNEGTVIVAGSIFSENNAAQSGGGIHNVGTATITGSTFSGNSATYSGGGIYNGGTATVTGSTISENSAHDGGGVLTRISGITAIKSCIISGNSATYLGGGIYNEDTATVTVTGSTISENNAYDAGGIYNGGTATVTGSTISGNSAAYNGGGISNYGNLVVKGKSQIKHNKAVLGYGGGIYSGDGSVTFDGSNAAVKNNKAHLPTSQSSWYQGWGVYLESGTPITTGGFDPAKQVTGNTQI